jgi:hypothetical protein
MLVDTPEASSTAVSQKGPSSSTATTVVDPLEHSAGKIIHHEGGDRFIDSQLWTTFYDEVRNPRRFPPPVSRSRTLFSLLT